MGLQVALLNNGPRDKFKNRGKGSKIGIVIVTSSSVMRPKCEVSTKRGHKALFSNNKDRKGVQPKVKDHKLKDTHFDEDLFNIIIHSQEITERTTSKIL